MCQITCLRVIVSLTSRELYKIILRKYTMSEIIFMLRISSCNFVRVPKAWLWAHVQSFNSKCNKKYDFSHIQILESSRNVSETSPGYIQRSEAYNGNKINAFPQRRITVNCPGKIGTVWDNGKWNFLLLDNTRLSHNNSTVSAWYQCDPQLSHFLCLSNENKPVLQQCG